MAQWGFYSRTFSILEFFCYNLQRGTRKIKFENFRFVDFDQKHNEGSLTALLEGSFEPLPPEFSTNFSQKVSRGKKRNTSDRFFVENKWK